MPDMEAAHGAPVEECGTCGDATCTAPGAAAHLYCWHCRWPHGEHRYLECENFAPEPTA